MACAFSRIEESAPRLIQVKCQIGKNSERTGGDGEIVEAFKVAPDGEANDVHSTAPELCRSPVRVLLDRVGQMRDELLEHGDFGIGWNE